MHRCVRCKHEYIDNDPKVLSGCSCGSKLFFFIKNKQDAEKIDSIITKLSKKEMDGFESTIERMSLEREKKVDEIIRKAMAEEKPEPAGTGAEAKAKKKTRKNGQKFGIETVRSLKPGVYEINIRGLLEGQPVILLSKGGSYIIHLPSVFEGNKK